jgi:hypothetical protein
MAAMELWKKTMDTFDRLDDYNRQHRFINIIWEKSLLNGDSFSYLCNEIKVE